MRLTPPKKSTVKASVFLAIVSIPAVFMLSPIGFLLMILAYAFLLIGVLYTDV